MQEEPSLGNDEPWPSSGDMALVGSLLEMTSWLAFQTPRSLQETKDFARTTSQSQHAKCGLLWAQTATNFFLRKDAVLHFITITQTAWASTLHFNGAATAEPSAEPADLCQAPARLILHSAISNYLIWFSMLATPAWSGNSFAPHDLQSPASSSGASTSGYLSGAAMPPTVNLWDPGPNWFSKKRQTHFEITGRCNSAHFFKGYWSNAHKKIVMKVSLSTLLIMYVF